ncbi:MAG: histone H1 [Duncaniella sp.]|nr:histone H1 [Barnesiella sp.]MBD5344163.1 histone H1 [Bacteroides sp.]MDE5829334.1 histone H1 [Duncaniella sp.]MBD5253515.1 histone H1 [Barnesiella sp.]MBD5368824.1 histone H1 [Bacteroides sp.]
MKNLVEKIATLCENFAKDAVAQVESGNKAAGARARKVSLELEKAMKEFRKLSIEESKK